MTVSEIANRLVTLCRAGKSEDAYRELFADDAVAYEMEGIPERETRGLAALIEKGQKHDAMIETLHEWSTSDPVIGGNFFSVSMVLDATYHERGRMRDEEICVYEVRDGKIVSERFFYNFPA